ncbi:MAG TPA: hypothetical protein VIY47_11825, partial [Ignavibacteriaceae bacterium]
FAQLIILLCLSFTLTALSQTKKEASFTVSSGDKLDVSIRQGNINIITGSGNQVKVLAKNIEEDELKFLTMEQKSGNVEIKFKGEDSDDFELELNIPSELNLDMSTGGGNISVKGDLKGTVDASTGGGNISAGNIFGKTDFSTAGGNVSVGDINGDADLASAGGDMKAGSINGNADISTAGGNISVSSVNKLADLSTAGGNITIGNVGGKISASTAGGNVTIGDVYGSAEISTAGGNIILESAGGEVEASTAAGNINLKNIKGAVDASTAAGNIYAELYPESNMQSELSSAIGNITLKVPGSAKVTIVARLSVGAWGDSDDALEHIKSDFSSTEVNKRGDKRQVEVIYKLNGGGPIIELNATMGEIEIRKIN